MYVGRSLLKVGGLCAVCTDPAQRMKGHGRVLILDTIEFMKREKFDFSLLYGIPNYYTKFGYSVVMANHFITVAAAEIPKMELTYSRDTAREKDLPAMTRLYNAQARSRDGNCRRRKMWLGKSTFKLTDGRGRLAAYANWYGQDGSLFVREGMARGAKAGAELLGAVKAVAWDEGLDHVNVQMPFGYPLTDTMRPLNATYRRMNTNQRGCMGAVLNLARLAGAMEAEWSALLSRSEFAAKSGRARVAVGDETLVLAYSKGKVKTSVAAAKGTASIPQEQFSQLLLGYTGVKTLADAGEISVRRDDMRLLETLFPERSSFLFGPDRF
jgi:hypothetical protein